MLSLLIWPKLITKSDSYCSKTTKLNRLSHIQASFATAPAASENTTYMTSGKKTKKRINNERKNRSISFSQLGPNNYSSYVEMMCINDPDGGSPIWSPPYDAVINPFPPCVVLRKYCLKTIK